MKNCDLREFKEIMLGEMFVEQGDLDTWLIKVDGDRVVPAKYVVRYDKMKPVWVKRGQVQGFLSEVRGVLGVARSILDSAVSVLDKFGRDGEKEDVGVEEQKAKVEANKLQKGWNKVGDKENVAAKAGQ
jgi:hypothetical protein